MMKNHFAFSAFSILLLCIVACHTSSVTQTSVKKEGNIETVTTKSSIGKQELATLKEQWEHELLVESGEAPVLNKYPEVERNKMLAKKGAVLDAQRKLAEKISYVRISANTTMQDFSTIDIVQSKINAYLKDVEIINETFDEAKKSYTVTVQMPKVKLINVLEEYLIK